VKNSGPMRLVGFGLPLVVAAALVGCEAAPPNAAAGPTHPPVAENGAALAPHAAAAPGPGAAAPLKLGAPITMTDTVALSDIAKQPAKFSQKTVRTEGTVKAVCQSMGCWMEIADDASQAHIKMAGHKFFVPKNASGRHAVVQAVVRGVPDDGECEQEAEEATGKKVKLELEATGVELM
jgi:hypothetical protein